MAPLFWQYSWPYITGWGSDCARPPYYYLTPKIFRPSNGPAAKGTLTNVMDSGEAPSPSQAEKWGHRLTACTLGWNHFKGRIFKLPFSFRAKQNFEIGNFNFWTASYWILLHNVTRASIFQDINIFLVHCSSKQDHHVDASKKGRAYRDRG